MSSSKRSKSKRPPEASQLLLIFYYFREFQPLPWVYSFFLKNLINCNTSYLKLPFCTHEFQPFLAFPLGQRPRIKSSIASSGFLTISPSAHMAVAVWIGLLFLSMISMSLTIALLSWALASAIIALRCRMFFPRQLPAIMPIVSLTKLEHAPEDETFLTSDYPLLPVRRRFWERVLRTIDTTGTVLSCAASCALYQVVLDTANAPPWPCGLGRLSLRPNCQQPAVHCTTRLRRCLTTFSGSWTASRRSMEAAP